MLKTILGALFACVAVSASPQVLTKAQEGRMEVGQCYSACMARYANTSAVANRRFIDWWVFTSSDEFAGLAVDVQEDAFVAFENTYCRQYWLVLQDLRTCRDGCLDIEAAYGQRTSRARTRFTDLFKAEIAAARRMPNCDNVDLTSTDGPHREQEPVKTPPKERARG